MSHVSSSSETIFAEAISIASPQDRASFLEQACQGDTPLLRELQKLVQDHFLAGSFLEHPAARIDTAPPQPLLERSGTQIGPYKLLEQIGEGGMGVVFMAEQRQPIQRKVALKIIKPGMDTQQVIARFEAERQALALMDHPNIARVLEAGTTESGRPYFVMELVHGMPVTDYCDRHRLLVSERLELFVTICQAVQHAHQKGIIHRDLKPTNVLVAQHDGRPLVKVIDFGVAKATSQKLTEKTVFTGIAQLIGTPLYMSPEQAELNAPDVDTRSDIYSLGVLLYELLTGSTPFETERLKAAAFDELRRIIREEEPPRPSTRISTLAQQAISTVSEKRNSDPRHLGRLFQGELDWIAMKTLEKDRNRRYETASALADDVERYLRDEPVQACPPSRIYRLRKFASRYRVGIAFVCACFGLFALGTAVSTWQAIRATRAEQQTKASEQIALKNSRRADAISEFLINAFRSPDPTRDGRSVTMAELLDRAVKDVEAEFANDEPMRADLLSAIAKSYEGLGLYREAVVLFAKVQELRAVSQGPLDTGTIESMSDLASAYENAGQRDKAISLNENMLKIQQAHLAADDPEVLATKTNLAWDYNHAGQSEKALALFQEMLRLAQAKVKASGPVPVELPEFDENGEAGARPKTTVKPLVENTFEHLDDTDPRQKDILVTLNNLAEAFAEAGHVEQAIPLYQQTLKLMQEKLGPDEPMTLTCMYNLAMAFKVAGRFDEAIPLFDETLRLRKERFGDSEIVARTLTCAGIAYGSAGNKEKQAELFGESLRITQKIYSDDHPETLEAMGQYAACLRDAGHEQEALSLFEKALAKCRLNPGVEHPTTLALMRELANTYQAVGRFDDAVSLFEELLKLRQATRGPNNPAPFSAMRYLARAYLSAGRLDDAIAMKEEILRQLKATRGPDHQETKAALHDLATTYEALGRFGEAVALHEELLRLNTATLGPNHRETMAAENQLGFALILQGNLTEAEKLLSEDLPSVRAHLPPDSGALSVRLHHLALALLLQDKFAEAEPLARESLQIQEKTAPDEWHSFKCRSLLGGTLLGQKKYSEAEPLLVSGYEGMHEREAKIPNDRKVFLRQALKRLLQLYEATNQPEKVAEWKEKLADYDKTQSNRNAPIVTN